MQYIAKLNGQGSMNLSEIYKAYMYSYPHKTKYGRLENIDVFDYLKSCDPDRLDYYFHIPFCVSKCGYCNLFSVAGQDCEVLDRYLAAMEGQVGQYLAAWGANGAEAYSFTVGGGTSPVPPVPPANADLEKRSEANEAGAYSFTVGGGTPLALSEWQLDRLFNLLPNMHKATSCIETSPNETTEAKVKILKTYEVDRISIGVQSFEEGELESLRRAHSAQSAQRALELLKKYDFPVLNIDLIYGIPGQTLSSLNTSIDRALGFDPDELFLYPLYIREGTDIYESFGREYVNPQIYEMYFRGREVLLDAGYTQVSMRRFAKNPPDNPGSCGFQDMLSIGCGGRTYLGPLHFCHPFTMDNAERLRTIESYIDAPDKTCVENGYILNGKEQKRRFVIKNLLHVYGLPLADYRNNFHADACVDFPILGGLIETGYAGEDDGRIRLTPKGLSLSDCIGPMLLGE